MKVETTVESIDGKIRVNFTPATTVIQCRGFLVTPSEARELAIELLQCANKTEGITIDDNSDSILHDNDMSMN